MTSTTKPALARVHPAGHTGQRRRWWWLAVPVAGTLAYLLVLAAYTKTGNLRYLPTLLAIGATVAPGTILAFVVGRIRSTYSAVVVAGVALGGIVSTVLAGVFEYELGRRGANTSLSVAIIEELAKLVVPMVIFFGHRRRLAALGPMFGILVGVSAGMGFGVIETVGYGLQTYLQHGSIDAVDQTLIDRAILSPTRHVAWTALTTAAIWRIPQAPSLLRSGCVAFAVLIAVIGLHTIWDGAGSAILHSTIAVVSAAALLVVVLHLDKAAPAPPDRPVDSLPPRPNTDQG